MVAAAAVKLDEAIDSNIVLPKDVKAVLHRIASGWSNVPDCRALEAVRLKGAMTNEVYQINWLVAEGEEPRKVLFRVYGQGVNVFFDRADEVRTFECMSKHGQGPKLLGRLDDGRVEEFIHAKTLTAADLRDPETSALIAAKLREFHGLDMPGETGVFLWDRLRNWHKTALELSSEKEAKEFRLGSMGEEIKALQGFLTKKNDRIGFCHNDLQYGNIMMDEETKLVTIIDYEYASYNPVAYDIANHFCEMAANYHTETPHVLDYDRYPELEERRRFVETYLASGGDKLSHADVDDLIQDIEKYKLASHLLWGLWGIISHHVNKIDFDYTEYARQRFNQYWQHKDALLLKAPGSP